MEGNLSNLVRPETVRTHIIDRLTTWLGFGGAAVFVILLGVGWPAIAVMAGDGHIWLLVGLALSLATASAALVFRYLISPIVGNQISGLADVAVAIAAGDLTRTPEAASQGGQLGRLARAMVRMSDELGQLGGLISQNAQETARHSTEITGGTEHMAQAAAGIAETASSLSLQASAMADTIRLLSLDAGRLNTLAGNVSSPATSPRAPPTASHGTSGSSHWPRRVTTGSTRVRGDSTRSWATCRRVHGRPIPSRTHRTRSAAS